MVQGALYFHLHPEAQTVMLAVTVGILLLCWFCNFYVMKQRKKRQDSSDDDVPPGGRRAAVVLGVLLVCAVLALAARILL